MRALLSTSTISKIDPTANDKEDIAERWQPNKAQCYIKHVEGKGRGVYASYSIAARTLIEISPVILFTKEEYDDHGQHTILDHYTFKWRDGRMALALGLGSLFNHSNNPNVSYQINSENDTILYTTTRSIEPDEELCIFYGHKLWFDPLESSSSPSAHNVMVECEVDEEWGGLSAIDDEITGGNSKEKGDVWNDGDPDDIISEEDLPFMRLKLFEDLEEETEAVRTMQAWVIDIQNSQDITIMLQWLKQSGLDDPSLSHLKRIRKKNQQSTLLLGRSGTIPPLPSEVYLGSPYQLMVPCSAALTPISLQLKSALWPTVFAPRRKGEPEKWTRGKVRWARDAIHHVVEEARSARSDGELPVIAYVPSPYKDEEQFPNSFTARDTRTSMSHPLRHAVLNIIRRVADYRASQRSNSDVSLDDSSASTPTSVSDPISIPDVSLATARNGAHYLLTGLTLFTTHEPCIMCSMAALHSRVRDVIYVRSMPRTGGCGGAACVPTLKGVNHRFGVYQWRGESTTGKEAVGLHEGRGSGEETGQGQAMNRTRLWDPNVKSSASGGYTVCHDSDCNFSQGVDGDVSLLDLEPNTDV